MHVEVSEIPGPSGSLSKRGLRRALRPPLENVTAGGQHPALISLSRVQDSFSFSACPKSAMVFAALPTHYRVVLTHARFQESTEMPGKP